MRNWKAMLMVLALTPVTASAVVWPQSEEAYHSQQRSPQWIETPQLQNVQPVPPVPSMNAPVRPYAGYPAAPSTPNDYGAYPGYVPNRVPNPMPYTPAPYPSYGYPSYGYAYPSPYLGYPRRYRDFWDRLPFIGRDGGDWGNWDMPSFDMPSMSFPSFGW